MFVNRLSAVTSAFKKKPSQSELNKNKLEDKLEIHFGKRRNGGGDIDQVVITEQCGVIGTFALITFAEKETVASVLKRQHIFFGKTLTVEPHSSTEEEQRNIDHNTPKKIKLSRLPQLPSQDFKLIIHGRYADNIIQSTAEITNVKLQVDEKSTKFCLEGPPSAIVQAVDILGKHNTETKTQPHGSGDVGQRKSVASWKTSLEGHEHRTEELIADKEALDTISVVEKYSDADPLKNDNDVPVTRRKDVPKLRQKKNIHPADTKKLPRNIAKFDPKILNYIHAIQHREITEAGDRFGVNFEAKANGEVEFKSRGQNTDQQRINESMMFLENLVNSIQEKGFVTEMVRLMQFKEAPKQKVDEAVQQTLKSTDVLVTLKASNTLEFFGTEGSVHHEIEKLRAGILGRELQTDSQSSIEQTVYNQTDGDGIHRPQEEMGSMAMVGNFRAKNYSEHPERLASLDEDITDEASSVQGLQFKKSVVAPARKPLVRPLVTPEGSSVLDNFQFSCVGNLVNGETYLRPEGPPTWKEGSYPSLCSVTYNEIRYPPNEAKQENQVSKQSCHRVDLTTYFNAESAPNEQDRSSDIVSEQDVKTAKPKVTFVYMNQGAYSPPMQHSRLLGATQDQDDGKDSRSCHDDDEVDGAGAFFVTNGAMGETLDMEPSPSCVSFEESSSGTDSHMEVDSIVPVTTSAAVPSPWDSLLFNMPPVDHSLGFASPAGISMAGIPDLYDIVNRSEDFTVVIRTGMKVIIRYGDITDEFTDVIVTSADRHLHLKNGVGRAVREAAGPELVRACQHWTQKNGPVGYGENVWTVGGNLKCSNVLHVVLRQSQGGTELKSTLMDLLKTCAQSLQASNVSMPAIGAERMSLSKQVWARAFFEAVCEITQLYDKGWIQLTTLVLVDTNRALLSEVKRVFDDPILSESLVESFQNVRQESFFPGMSNGFTGSDACSVPRFRARGSSGVLNGASRKGFGKTQSVSRWSSQTSTRKDSSGVKSAFMDDLSVDEDHKCAICLGRIVNKKKLRCNHSFCRGCLDTALKVHKYCPLCKQPVT